MGGADPAGPAAAEDIPREGVTGSAQAAPGVHAAPTCRQRTYILTGGGSGIGKAAYAGSEAAFVARHPKKALQWCSVRVSAGAQTGDVISWNRAYLRELRADGSLASAAPTWEELALGGDSESLAPSPPVDAAPSRAAPRASPLAPPLAAEERAAAESASPVLPPLPPPLRGGMAGARCLLVLCDLEVYGWRGGRGKSGYVAELAATALCRDAAGAWGVPVTGGRFSALGAPDNGSRKALSAESTAEFTAWLTALSTAAGQKVIMLAHNGPAHDWPHLRQHLEACSTLLPLCVGALGDTKELFLGEKREAMHTADGKLWWSMQRIYKCRFGADDIPDAHQAVGDVAAMERIFEDVHRKHDAQWLEDAVRRCGAAGWPHLAALQRRSAAGASSHPVAPATPTPRSC